MGMNPQAEELNNAIIEANKNIYELLSERGKAIFFPKKGILGQTADAKGKSINATIGIALEEDGTPMRLSAVEKSIMIEPKNAFPYAPSFGRPDIREVWKKKIYEKNPTLHGKEISLPVVTNALTHGLSIAGYLFVDDGDEIITPDLYWGNYRLIFSHAYGARMKTFETFKDGGFNIDGLKESIDTTGKNIVALNFPNNPTGYSPTKEEAEKIKDVLLEAAEGGAKIVAIVDDAYFGLAYEDGVYGESLFSKLCDLHENILAVKIDGATKEDYVWGFRVGFVTYGFKGMTPGAADALASKTSGAVRGNISNASNLSQSIMLNAYNDPSYREEKKGKYELLKKRYDEVKKVIDSNPEFNDYFKALPFNSGYFMCLRAKEGINTEDVRQKLLKDFDTGVIVFGDIIRVAFSAVPVKNIAKLFDNIYNACKETGGS